MSETKCPHCGYQHNQDGVALCLQCGAMLPSAKQYSAPSSQKGNITANESPTVVVKPGQKPKSGMAEPPTMRVQKLQAEPHKPSVSEPPTVVSRQPTTEPPTVKGGPAQPSVAEPPTMKVHKQQPEPLKPPVSEPPTVVSKQPTTEPPTVKGGPAQPSVTEPPTMKVQKQQAEPHKPPVSEPPTVVSRQPTKEPPTVKGTPAQPSVTEPPTMKVQKQQPEPHKPAVSEPPTVVSRQPTPELPTAKGGPAQPSITEPPTMRVERQKPQTEEHVHADILDMPTVKVDKQKGTPPSILSQDAGKTPPPPVVEQPTAKGGQPSVSIPQTPETPTVVVRRSSDDRTISGEDERTVKAGIPSKRIASATLTIKHGGRKGIEFDLNVDTLDIGRWDADSGSFPEIDLTPDDRDGYISRKHARIFYQEGNWFIEDMGSVNGTFVNKGARLLPKRPAELHNGDEIILGKIFFTFTTG